MANMIPTLKWRFGLVRSAVVTSMGVEHIFEITAESLYEAVARGLATFRSCRVGESGREWLDDHYGCGQTTRSRAQGSDARFRGVARIERPLTGGDGPVPTARAFQ